MKENLNLSDTTERDKTINWTYENLCLVGLYIVMIYGVLYHCLYKIPVSFYNKLRYGKLDDEYIKKYGNDYTFKKKGRH